jgi:hypothetical protein
LQIQAGGAARVFAGDTRVQFHHDHIRLLVVHEWQLAIYDTSKLEKIRPVSKRAEGGFSFRLVFHRKKANAMLSASFFARWEKNPTTNLHVGFGQWIPRDTMPSSISNATYSCDSQHVYASFVDGSIGVFEGESLRPRCRLASSAYLPAGVNR